MGFVVDKIWKKNISEFEEIIIGILRNEVGGKKLKKGKVQY